MSQLKELIGNELKVGDRAQVGVQRLYEATRESPTYTRLVGGMFVPDVGVIGDWSSDEKEAVIDIINAREQAHSLGHAFGRAMTGQDDPNVAKHKTAYQILEGMRPGDIAKVHVGQSDYYLAAFPAQMPATSLVLFVK